MNPLTPQPAPAFAPPRAQAVSPGSAAGWLPVDSPPDSAVSRSRVERGSPVGLRLGDWPRNTLKTGTKSSGMASAMMCERATEVASDARLLNADRATRVARLACDPRPAVAQLGRVPYEFAEVAGSIPVSRYPAVDVGGRAGSRLIGADAGGVESRHASQFSSERSHGGWDADGVSGVIARFSKRLNERRGGTPRAAARHVQQSRPDEKCPRESLAGVTPGPASALFENLCGIGAGACGVVFAQLNSGIGTGGRLPQCRPLCATLHRPRARTLPRPHGIVGRQCIRRSAGPMAAVLAGGVLTTKGGE